MTPSVLFVCVHNAGRSPDGRGSASQHLAGDRIEVRSAEHNPYDEISPAAVAAMARNRHRHHRGHTERVLTGEAVESSDVVITMGCGDTCPYFPGVSYRDWKLDDPAGQPVEVVHRIRDDIAERVGVDRRVGPGNRYRAFFARSCAVSRILSNSGRAAVTA